jgi:hypothetical protein
LTHRLATIDCDFPTRRESAEHGSICHFRSARKRRKYRSRTRTESDRKVETIGRD